MICIECTNSDIECLYFKYKSDYIKLTICSTCGKVADKYIEYDNVILFIDILLLKPQAYRHLAYNETETALLKDRTTHKDFNGIIPRSISYQVISFMSRYQKLVRLIVMMILFEVYLTWAYEEKKSDHTFIMGYILKQEIYTQYAFFLLRSIIEELALNLSIQYFFRLFLGWGSTPNKSFNKSYQRGYYTYILLITVLVSSCIKLFPIIMLIWPYDKTSVSYTAIKIIGFLNTIECLRVVTSFNPICITMVLFLSLSIRIVASNLIIASVVSYFSKLSLHDLLANELNDSIDAINKYMGIIYDWWGSAYLINIGDQVHSSMA